MPEAPTPARLIPNWDMQEPWTSPMSPEEEEGLAQTALLAGVAPTDTAVTQLLGRFAGDYVIDLGRASG